MRKKRSPHTFFVEREFYLTPSRAYGGLSSLTFSTLPLMRNEKCSDIPSALAAAECQIPPGDN